MGDLLCGAPLTCLLHSSWPQQMFEACTQSEQSCTPISVIPMQPHPASRTANPRWASAGQQRYGAYVERLLQAGALRAGLRAECPGAARALAEQACGRQPCPHNSLKKKLCAGSTLVSSLVHRVNKVA